MYQRRYPGEDWEIVPEATARDKLSGYYNNVDVILSELQAGNIIQTPWAQWRYVEKIDGPSTNP
jgi:hypothetical protein